MSQKEMEMNQQKPKEIKINLLKFPEFAKLNQQLEQRIRAMELEDKVLTIVAILISLGFFTGFIYYIIKVCS